jgi:hypothetical protein
MLNNFDVASVFLNMGDKKVEARYPNFRNRLDLFFIDHEMVPLLILENYLNA